MPTKPKKLCSYPGCSNLTDGRFCEQHQKQEKKRIDERRWSANERGYDYRWRKVRYIYLRDNPLCVECEKEGILTPATVIDHIIPHKGNYDLFWDVNNWQPLCKRHHDIKTAKEDGRWGKK